MKEGKHVEMKDCCPVCGQKLGPIAQGDHVPVSDILGRMGGVLYNMSMEIAKIEGSADPALVEQFRRNCETITAMIRTLGT